MSGVSQVHLNYNSVTVSRGGKLGFSSGKKFVGSTYNNSTQSTIADGTMDVVVLESQKVDGGKHLEGPFFFSTNKVLQHIS